MGALKLEFGQLAANVWQAFQAQVSRESVWKSLGAEKFPLFERLMTLPCSQTEKTHWLQEPRRPLELSEIEIRETFLRRLSRKLCRSDSHDLTWKVDDFERKAKMHNLEYLGCPRAVAAIDPSLLGFQEWLDSFDPPMSLAALSTTQWDAQYVPAEKDLHSKVWW